jgi:tRNA(Ile)-lysidine synthase
MTKERDHITQHVLRKVETTIRSHRLIQPGERLVVGLSGGPDSVALLSVLQRLKDLWRWEIAVVHLHHGLRQEEADEDLEFVRRLAAHHGLPFFCRRLPPGCLESNVEDRARRLRYAFLEETRVRWQGDRIVVGHHADDQAETVLGALLRGTGTSGLRGMPYKRNAVVRPLLDLTKKEIILFLRMQSIPFRTDSTNQDLRYRRNRIRHLLLPLLKEQFNPAVEALLRRTARVCTVEDAFLESQVDRYWETAVIDGAAVKFPVDRYRIMPVALRLRLLRRAYTQVSKRKRTLSLRHLEALDRLAHADGAEKGLDWPGGVRGVVSGGLISIGPMEQFLGHHWSYTVEYPGKTMVPEAGIRIHWHALCSDVYRGRKERVPAAAFALDALKGELLLRSPRAGDRFRPLGLGGSRKVKDLLIDRRVPRKDRWRIPILVDEEGILWVVGHRLDERARVYASTRWILTAWIEPMESERQMG